MKVTMLPNEEIVMLARLPTTAPIAPRDLPTLAEVSEDYRRLELRRAELMARLDAIRAEKTDLIRRRNAHASVSFQDRALAVSRGEALPEAFDYDTALARLHNEEPVTKEALHHVEVALGEEKRRAAVKISDLAREDYAEAAARVARSLVEIWNALADAEAIVMKIRRTGADPMFRQIEVIGLGEVGDRSSNINFTLRRAVEDGFLNRDELPEVLR